MTHDNQSTTIEDPKTIIDQLVSINILEEWPIISARYSVTDNDIEQVALTDAFMSLVPKDANPDEYLHANMDMVRMIGVALDRIFGKDDLKVFLEVSHEYTFAAGFSFIDALTPEAPFLIGHTGNFHDTIRTKAIVFFTIFLAGTAGYKDPKATIGFIRNRISGGANFARWMELFDFEKKDAPVDLLSQDWNIFGAGDTTPPPPKPVSR